LYVPFLFALSGTLAKVLTTELCRSVLAVHFFWPCSDQSKHGLVSVLILKVAGSFALLITRAQARGRDRPELCS